MENIHVSMIAIIIAVVANFILGFLWYTPLFGKAWAKEMGFDLTVKPPSSALVKGMVFMVIGNFLMAWVFAHNMTVWDPATWGQARPSDWSPMSQAFAAAIFTWLGFYLPVDLGRVAWEKASWKLFFINTGHHFAMLLVAALIIAHVH